MAKPITPVVVRGKGDINEPSLLSGQSRHSSASYVEPASFLSQKRSGSGVDIAEANEASISAPTSSRINTPGNQRIRAHLARFHAQRQQQQHQKGASQASIKQYLRPKDGSLPSGTPMIHKYI
jgi:hypothetical protein